MANGGASGGIDKDKKEKLLKRYNKPTGLETPILNPEIEAAMSTAVKKRDNYMKEVQDLAGSPVIAIGSLSSSLPKI